MHLGLTAPTEKQARAFAAAFRQNAEDIYQTVLTKMLDFAEKK
jgi:ABC-type transporter MlaC component